LIDLDHYLENKYFKTIPQIFAEEGEDNFRKKEQNVLHEVSTFEDVIVATGGGAPCFFDNMEVMNRTGFCVFLDVDTEELVERLIHAKSERPIIKGKTEEELAGFIGEMMKKRRPFYERAKYILKGKNIRPEQIVQIIRENT
jgi:shikimate kinase